jgi:hypothetical protein
MDSQLFVADVMLPLGVIEETGDDEEEGVKLDRLSRMIVDEEDGEGVGVTGVSSSVEAIGVRVALELITVD